jgi:hypothetical protein
VSDSLLVEKLEAARTETAKKRVYFEGAGPFATPLGRLYKGSGPDNGLWIWLPADEAQFIKNWRKKEEAVDYLWPLIKAAVVGALGA